MTTFFLAVNTYFNRTENNIDWYKKLSVVEFLRETGRHIRVGDMLARTSVASRLQSSEGLSFTEFSYQVCFTQMFGIWSRIAASLNCLSLDCKLKITMPLLAAFVCTFNSWPTYTHSVVLQFFCPLPYLLVINHKASGDIGCVEKYQTISLGGCDKETW